jgi:hypothetical protein
VRLEEVRGIASAQRRARSVIHDVAATLAAGDTERRVAERIEDALMRAGVRTWLHTAYAWFGERTRFGGFHDWEPDALPTERPLLPGEPYLLDAAPFVDGYPADYAFSGVLGEAPDAGYGKLRDALTRVKSCLVGWAREARDGKTLFDAVGAAARVAGLDAVHPLYPGAVLGHRFDSLPGWLQRLPRVGWGFQLPLVAGYGLAIFRHKLAGTPYPLLNPVAAGRPVGIFAVEPHLASGPVGAKFESILLLDGDETRWLDPELFGEVTG